jgi:prepilin peptidase CpaA
MKNLGDPGLTIVLISILIVAAIVDVRIQKIPNLLTFPSMIVGFTYHSVVNGWSGLIFSSMGLTVGIAIFLLPYLMGGMGAGDAKLMGVVGAMIGPKGVALACLFTAIVGGFYALIVFLLNIEYRQGFIERSAITVKAFAFTKNFIPIPPDESEKKPRLCYAVAIAIGTLIYVFLKIFGYQFPV